MAWWVYAALPVLAGFGAYLCYLLFLVAVLVKDGADGVAKVAQVVPAPKWWVDSIAKAIATRKAGDGNGLPHDQRPPHPDDEAGS